MGPLIVPLTLLKYLLTCSPKSYVERQVYLEPHSVELMLSYRQIEGKSATKLTDLDFLTEIAIVAVCSGAPIFTPINTVVTRGGRQRMDCR